MARRSGLEELELSGEEAARLAEAFRDPQFRSLFAEYAAELADPAQRARYEAEVAALERERGVEARFLHPEPGWVLRTSQAGRRRCYVNICSHPLVGRPQALRAPGGCTWRLPHCLAPGREEPRRLLYDVLFHPDALRLAARSARLRRLLDDTALEALDTHFQAGLDRANAVPLRGVRYKGAPQATLLRTPLPGGPPPREEEEEDSPLPPFPTPYAYPPPAPQEAGTRPAAPAAEAAPTEPRWSLRQRSHVDLQDYRCSRDSAPSPVPRELVVTVELPLLSAAAQAQLEVRGQELQLDSQRPAAAYRLRLRLPYPVDEGRGRAIFNKATRQLVVTLPVLPAPGPALEPPQQQQPRDEPDPPPPDAPVRRPSATSPGLAADCGPPPPACPEVRAGACTGVGLTASGSVDSGTSRPASPAARAPPRPASWAPAELPGAASISAAQSCLGDVGGPAATPTRRGSSGDQVPELGAAGGRSPPCPSGGGSSVALPGWQQGGSPASAPLLPPEGEPPAPASRPASPLCPPFCCAQDEDSLTLLLQVPDIVPQSLEGEVGPGHYRVGFCTDSASYALLLQLLPENGLTPPETEISVSRNNAVIGLAKSPETAGLWTKLYFGLSGEDLKERWLLTEDNVDGFLGSLAAASCPDQSTGELQPLVEVLDVSEGKSQIRLKGEEPQGAELGDADARVGPARTDCGHESGREPPAKADSHLLPTTGTSGSLGAREAMGRAGWESGHCSELKPWGPSLLIPGKLPISTQSHEEPECACTTSKEATSSTQAQRGGGEPAKAEGEEGHSQLAGNQGDSGRSSAPPVLRETDMRDGHVQLICQHTTHCTVTFQNPLLYELD